MPRGPLAVICAAALMGAPAAAQDTRAALLERQRAEKAERLEPYTPQRLEKTLLYIERTDPLSKIAPHNGFFVQYGYSDKPVGSGIGFGGGWRHDLLRRNARLVFEIGHTFRGYRMARGDLSLPYLLDDRFEIGVEGRYRDHPQEDFYGLGFNTSGSDRVNFRFRAPEVQARAVVTPVPWLSAGTRVGRLAPDIGRGTDTRYRSIEERFSGGDAPGLALQPDFTYADLFTALDTRDQPGNARAGSLLDVQWRRYSDTDAGRYSFTSVQIDAQQFLPIFDKKRVVAIRLRLDTTAAADGQEVPFYFQPTLGGSTSLRSYADHRFRDRNALAINVEYRWEAFSGLDMALFSDFGTVAPRVRDLEFAGLRGAYGIGLRFNTYKAVFLRLDVAAGGSEGIRTFLKYSKVF
ncbi:MAG TPA: BamA/TamA family outer membrane protein [Vicinamibacterales bacterium]|nr:BamA/TamA family outer membrane protein [Vicinamibacterales bacterium]